MQPDIGGRAGKDARLCPVCGKEVPPSLGTKPRKYCSAACGEIARRPAAKPSVCMHCGVPVEYVGRGPRSTVACHGCLEKARRRRKERESHACLCKRCGKGFVCNNKKRTFCSDECRYGPDARGTKANCKRCGNEFIKPKRNSKYCSLECRNDIAKQYVCLNCEKPFKKRRFKSGAYSCQSKYCSRECAFEARRLKKSCARRPIDSARSLASWFVSWGDDYYPHVYKCRTCGVTARSFAGSEPQSECYGCRTKVERMCRGCGVVSVTGTGTHYCPPCKEEAARKSKRKAKKRRRRIHGGDTIRSRCRRVGAPYTPVSRREILERDGWKCQLCGVDLLREYTLLPGGGVDHRSPTVDHIVPVAKGPGGPGHVESNVHAACWGCNTEKGTEDRDSFVRRKATGVDSMA